jgi:long-chain acyl-CoA synthetase
VAQVVVFGEAQPSLSAVIVPRGAVPDSVLEAAVQAVNRRLPDYARIGGWLRADAPFSAANGQATDNGRVRRDQVWACYGDRFTAHPTHSSGEIPDVLL